MLRMTAVLLAASALAVPLEAHANPRPLPFTYPVGTLAPGELELEQYIDTVPVTVLDEGGKEVKALRFELQTEFEVGLAERWELGFYVTGGQAGDGPFELDGLKQRVHGRFADEGEWPIDVGVYLEVVEAHDAIEFEEKILLAKRLGDFLLLLNLSVEQEIPLAGGEIETVYNPSLGASYAFTPGFSLGIEAWMKGEFEGGTPEVYLGPTMMAMIGKHFFSLGAYGHLAGTTTQGPGNEYGDLWVRAVLGIGL